MDVFEKECRRGYAVIVLLGKKRHNDKFLHARSAYRAGWITMEPKLFVAMKAFVVHDGKVLLLRESVKDADRTNVGLYDVVGGRIKPGQRFDESLLREVREETALAIRIGKPFFVSEWRPVVRGEQWHIVGTFFECSSESDRVTLSDEHDDFQWIDPHTFRKYHLIENLFPAFEAYLQYAAPMQ